MTVDVRDVYFSYGKRDVLRNVSFSVNQSELISIVGPNGAGKSTLFQCMLGNAKGFTGVIAFDGQSVLRMDARALARKVAYVPQSHDAAFHYTVMDMVLMGTAAWTSAFTSPGRRQEDVAAQALEKVGIANLAMRDYARISGGERQLVLIARALAQQSRVLIMDEPTANLDFGNQTRVLKQIRTLADEGYTVIQSTHNPEQAYSFSDRILAMHGGGLIAEGAPKEIFSAGLISRLYGIDVRVESILEDKVRICVPTAYK